MGAADDPLPRAVQTASGHEALELALGQLDDILLQDDPPTGPDTPRLLTAWLSQSSRAFRTCGLLTTLYGPLELIDVTLATLLWVARHGRPTSVSRVFRSCVPMTMRRIDPQGGYDRWAETYDTTANPVVAFDERVIPALIDPQPGKRILDAGCGTGRHIGRLLEAGASVTGMDFSSGMLAVATARYPQIDTVQGDLQARWPFAHGGFDAVLCALVGEHLDDLDAVAGEMHRVIRPGGRAVFSVYHPAMSAAGKEAHFRRDEVEYRLGAVHHELDDYRAAFSGAGFRRIEVSEHAGDAELVTLEPDWTRYLGFPMLLTWHMGKRG